jgi:hypothetical protein
MNDGGQVDLILHNTITYAIGFLIDSRFFMGEAGSMKGNQPLTAHDAERQLMAPGRQLMAENDRSWGISAGF